jgi:hypothetical protein
MPVRGTLYASVITIQLLAAHTAYTNVAQGKIKIKVYPGSTFCSIAATSAMANKYTYTCC